MPEHLMADIPQKVLIGHEGKVLLTHDVDGTWQPPGGRLDVGEQPREGLVREMMEELGAEIVLGRVIHTFVFTSRSGLAHFVVVYAGMLKEGPEDLKPDPKEMSEIRWFGPGEFEGLDMREGYKEALRSYFDAGTA